MRKIFDAYKRAIGEKPTQIVSAIGAASLFSVGLCESFNRFGTLPTILALGAFAPLSL